MWSSLKRLLIAIPFMFALALINVFICFSCAGMVGLQLNLMGVDKTLTLVVSLLTALGVYGFIIMNHRIRELFASLMPGDK